MKAPLKTVAILFSFCIQNALADRQAIVGTITSSGFVQGTPVDAADGLIKETEFRLSPEAPTENPMDGKIIHITAKSTQDMIIPLGAFLPSTWTLRFALWKNNQGDTGSMVVTHGYTTETTFDNKGPWIINREGYAANGAVKLIAKRQVWNGGWGVLYYLQVDRQPNTTQPLEVSITIEANNRVDEYYGTAEHAISAATVNEIFSIDSYYKKATLNSAFNVNGAMTLNGSPVTTSSILSSTLLSQGYVSMPSDRIRMGSSAVAVAGSIALGSAANAQGTGAIAMGTSASASQSNAVAIGSGALAGGGSSVSIGEGASGGGDYSFSTTFGVAEGHVAIAMGTGEASGDSSIAMGGYDWLWGNWPANRALGENSTSIGGIGNKANAFSSTANGFWTVSNASYSTALGSLNLGAGTSGTEWIETDPIFELGNGYAPRSTTEPASTTRSNAVSTLKNGLTTLTNKAWKNRGGLPITADPSPSAGDAGGSALVVEGHTEMKGNTTIDGDSVLKGKVTIQVPQGDISMGIYE